MPTLDGTLRQHYDEFAARLTANGGHSMLVDSLDDVLATVHEVPGRSPDTTVWISDSARTAYPELVSLLEASGFHPDTPRSPGDARDAPLGIAAARLAIAETGSVLLQEDDLPSRSVSLVTRQLIVLCPLDSLVPSLDDAAPVLREIAANGPSYATLVTGPSRTADIERELAVGVQGPGVLRVAFIAKPAN